MIPRAAIAARAIKDLRKSPQSWAKDIFFTLPIYHRLRAKRNHVVDRLPGLAFGGQSEYCSAIIMKFEPETARASFSPGRRRYLASAFKESHASGFLEAAERKPRDSFLRAIHELSAEDEDMPLPDEQSPIVFKDGIFQIDVSNTGAPPPIDPALKGLIDSILGS